MRHVEQKILFPWNGSKRDGKRDKISYVQRFWEFEEKWGTRTREKGRGMALLIILGVVWTSEDETRGSSLDYHPSCRREFYPTIFFLPFSGLINFESRDWETKKREGRQRWRGVMKFRWRRVSWNDFSKFEERGDFIYCHEIGFNARLNVEWLITLGMAITDRKFLRARLICEPMRRAGSPLSVSPLLKSFNYLLKIGDDRNG